MIELKHLSKIFPGENGPVEALKDVSLTIPDGDIFGIIGMSGAGKSTLVRCIDLLERPTAGSVIVDGVNAETLSEREKRIMRRQIAMIFQGFYLLMQRTCLQNVCFPLRLAGVRPAEAKRRALELLELVGLADKAGAYPAHLSGGQQQRAAIARALAADPKVLLCDEATSALDPATTSAILDLLQDVNRRLGITVIVITHQMSVVERICRHVAILDGGSLAEQGEVGQVFSDPRSAAARRLVFPEGGPGAPLACRKGERFIRVVFNGARATATPLIARMALEQGIAANIAYASTRAIGERMFGSMLLGVTGGDGPVSRAVAYLTEMPDVLAEEVTRHD
ncbi:MAG: ATP-binding cassette domain-containing protein [Clostridia bacterium]|nr:ATP-binding cassette domain-containing protein [Clostridia bacterium]